MAEILDKTNIIGDYIFSEYSRNIDLLEEESTENYIGHILNILDSLNPEEQIKSRFDDIKSFLIENNEMEILDHIYGMYKNDYELVEDNDIKLDRDDFSKYIHENINFRMEYEDMIKKYVIVPLKINNMNEEKDYALSMSIKDAIDIQLAIYNERLGRENKAQFLPGYIEFGDKNGEIVKAELSCINILIDEFNNCLKNKKNYYKNLIKLEPSTFVPKYKLLDNLDGLYRIVRNAKNDVIEYGGLIDEKVKLSQIGDCWIDEETTVLGNVEIKDNACIHNSVICGDDEPSEIKRVLIADNAVIANSRIGCLDTDGQVKVYGGDISIIGNSELHNVTVLENSMLSGNCVIKADDNQTYSAILKSKLQGDITINGYFNICNSEVVGYGKYNGDVNLFNSKLVNCTIKNAKINECDLINTKVIGLGRTLNLSNYQGKNKNINSQNYADSLMNKRDNIKVR